jgi:hypothetical protein
MNPNCVWYEFIAELRKGPLPAARFRPYPSLEYLAETLESILNTHLRPHLLAAAERNVEPESYGSGNQIHFILPILPGEEVEKFCFSFLVENEYWFFQHMENIFIRLDQIGALPVSSFPDLPEDKKAWARDEIQISETVRHFNILAAEKGKEFAFHCFQDGQGYFVGARAWVPFVPPSKAFILYACWDFANLHNNPITLLKLDETQAVIQGRLRYFTLYRTAAHLSQQISFEDYSQLFATIWQDRADCAGWNLRITMEQDDVTFFFTRSTEAED